MDSRKIVKNILKKDFSTVLDDIQLLISSEDGKVQCSEICSILRVLYDAMPSTADDLTESQGLAFDLMPSINLCLDYAKSSYTCSDLAKHKFSPLFYHIVRTFLKVELYNPAISSARILKTLLGNTENDFEDKMTYIKNLSVIFWNEALHVEQVTELSKPDTAFLLRFTSISFLLLDKTNNNSNEKVTLALLRYCQSNDNIDYEKLSNFLHEMWFEFKGLSVTYDNKIYLYKVLYSWFEVLIKYGKELSFLNHFLSWFQDLSDSTREKDMKLLNLCCDMSRLCIQLFIFQESRTEFKKVCLQYIDFCRSYKQWSESDFKAVAHSCGIIYITFAKCFRPLKSLEDNKITNFLKSSIDTCIMLVQHYIEMFSREEIQKQLLLPPSVKYYFCHSITNLLVMLLKTEHNDKGRKQLIKKAEDFVKFSYTKLMNIVVVDDLSKLVIGYAAGLSRFGMSLYGFGLYAESSYFLETGESFISLCSSTSDYKASETQFTLWKIHEILAYAYFLSGNHEKSLFVIAKSLSVHKKIKECFDVWRKVKKDANSKGKQSILPYIISDILSQMNIMVSVDEEISFLVEEFKMSKSERCSFVDETVAIVKKLLTMPCPKNIRAFILQEVLTMPENIAGKVASDLKMSLLEMCLEAINLFKDHLAENSTDYASKLYLSITYFWVYHINLKKIHEIAEKEAENNFKPTPLKTKDGRQNDVEDENETCDIQPTHPLVCLSIENETFMNLELAIQLWNEISEVNWKNLSEIVIEKNVLAIIQATAEIYTTASRDLKELKLWHLLHSVSISVENKLYELIACTSQINFLLRLGYLNMASYFVKLCDGMVELSNSIENKIALLKFELAKSNYFLHAGKFDEGLKIVRRILKSTVLEKKFKSVKMLHIEVLLLQSEYLFLPMKAFSDSENIEHIKSSYHLSSTMEALSLCKTLLKHISSKLSSGIDGFDWICFKPLLVKNLLRSHLQLGELYFKAGDPRFARCYLQEGLKIAESHILTYWSCKILLTLGHIDMVCDKFRDCQVKASGLKYILAKDTKINLEMILQVQAKYSSPNCTEPTSPDSCDDLIISCAPDITLLRNIKQTYIDKIDVMSSPVSKRLAKNRNKISCNFIDDAFSINLLQIESSFLYFLVSETEADIKESEIALQELLDEYDQIKNPDYLHKVLKTIKLVSKLKDPLFRFQSKSETLICTSVLSRMLQHFCIKNDTLKAKSSIDQAYSVLKKASHNPNYLFPDIYAHFRYHDIRLSLCEYFKIPSNSSITHYICPSVKCNVSLKKVLLENTPGTPSSKDVPKIIISEHITKTKRCQAPLKRNLLNSAIKRDMDNPSSAENSIQNCSPLPNFNISDDETFESPYDSLNRASKSKSAQRKNRKLNSRTDNSKKEISYQFFKSKNEALSVKSASDVWNLCLNDTPKLGKENRKLRSKTILKETEVVKRKTRATAAKLSNCSQTSKPKSNRLKKKSSLPKDSDESSESLKLNSDSAVDLVPERKMSVEHSRGSPHDRIWGKNPLSANSKMPGLSLDFTDSMLSSDSVFFTPVKSVQAQKVPNLIEDLCKDLNALAISKNKPPPLMTAGNLEEIIEELEDLRMVVESTMPYPLYPNICRLLAVLNLIKSSNFPNVKKNLQCSFLLGEAFCVSLRNAYIASLLYYKDPELFQEKDAIFKTLKASAYDTEQHIESFLQKIPENWTVVQVSAFHSQEYLATSDPIPCPTKLIICQYRKNCAPLIVSADSSSNEKFSSSFLAEFEKILEESSLTMLNKDSKLWWNSRSSLDVRLKELIKSMENIWLGCWKGLFLGSPQNEERLKQLQKTVATICESSQTTPCANRTLLQILVDSAQFLSKEQVSAAVSYLWNCSPEDNIHVKLCQAIKNISVALPNTERHPVILILDEAIQALPWECMRVLNGVPVTRMPSQSILHYKLSMLTPECVLSTGMDASKTYYVLNPGGDLTYSQQYFQNKFEKQIEWTGIIGRAPTVDEFIAAFKKHDLFVYCGHGSGKRYFEGTVVDKLKFKAASLLMGCSSGKLKRLGRVLESHGFVLQLLLSGCPAIAANLWDVTDKDIDRFTDRFLQSFVPDYDGLQGNQYDIAKAASVARGACKMHYLVGAAPVVYGFPIFAKMH